MTTLRLTTAATDRNPNVHDIYLTSDKQPQLIGNRTEVAATRGVVWLTVNLNAGITVTAGSIASDGASSRWVIRNATTNGGGAPANFVVYATCERTGPIEAAVGAITTIETPIAGWNSVTNAAAAEPGDGAIDADLAYAMGVIQRIKTRILLIAGEWYLDIRQGTPWRDRIWQKGVTEFEVRAILRAVILGTPGVAEVRSISASINAQTRLLTVTDFVVVTDDRVTVSTADLDEPFIMEVQGAY